MYLINKFQNMLEMDIFKSEMEKTGGEMESEKFIFEKTT